MLGLTWTGGIDELRDDAGDGGHEYIIPEDGTLYWMDTWVILTGRAAPAGGTRLAQLHPRPADPGRRRRRPTTTPPPNDEAKKYVDPAILDNPTVFVPQDIFDSASSRARRTSRRDPLRVEIWEEFKSSIGG